jgi:ATP-dependent exoDNAse (exonuclease V) alpha subunit
MKEIVTQLRDETDGFEGGATAVTISARAARVVEKVANIEALTFEQFKYRYYNPPKRNPLSPRRALIVDETSMFASADLKKTIEMAVDIGYERIILAGDKDQLPPIGWGAPFADLIKSAACPVTTLNTIHRTDAGGGIAQICRDLREGKPLRRDYSNVKICDATNDELAAQVSDIYARFVSLVKSPGDIMVLSPYSGANQDFGAPALSLAIRTALELPDRMTVGDIVIGTENERRRRYILNGSRGVVLREGSEREGVDYRGLCPRGKDFLGYRPSVGELIAAFLLAIIAERTGRWFSRLWDFLLDKGRHFLTDYGTNGLPHWRGK